MESGFAPETRAWSLESLLSLQSGALRNQESGVWRSLRSLECGVTPESGGCSLDSLRSLESGVWSHYGV